MATNYVDRTVKTRNMLHDVIFKCCYPVHMFIEQKCKDETRWGSTGMHKSSSTDQVYRSLMYGSVHYILCFSVGYEYSLQWSHNEHDGISNHQPQLCIQAQIKENIKAPRHWPLWGEFTGDRWIPRTKGQYAENVSVWWRHYGFIILPSLWS